MHYLPTYEDCVAICEKNGDLLYYETKFVLEGYPVSLFNYRLSPPFEEEGSMEMRGLAFVFNKDGSLYKRYLLIRKFWNLGQKEETLIEKVIDKKIINVAVKEDGSVATFIRLPNGSVYGKSKMSFDNVQSIEIQKIYNTNEKLRELVNFALDNDIVPIFEYVSPENFVVVSYYEPKLVLIRMRSNITGEYISLSEFSHLLEGVDVVDFDKYKNHSLSDLMQLTESIEDLEGWVVEFEDGMLIKLKGAWYCLRHSLYFRELQQENTILKLILSENLDDILGILPSDDPKRLDIDNYTNMVNEYVLYTFSKVKELAAKGIGMTQKEFAALYIREELFPIAVKIIHNPEQATDEYLIDMIKHRLGRDTFHLMDARKWINKYKFLIEPVNTDGIVQ